MSLARGVGEALLVACLLGLFARTFIVQAYRIPSASMAPGLLAGDRVLVNKAVYRTAGDWKWLFVPSRSIQRGDVVVFRYPEDPRQTFVKRCVARGGDEVQLVDKVLLVNHAPVEEPWAEHLDSRTYPAAGFLEEPYRIRDNFAPLQIPSGHYWCLGDNRDYSLDSRSWGSVPEALVIGHPFLIYWSSGPTEKGDAVGVRWGRILRTVP